MLISNELLTDLYKNLFFIRRVEEICADEYRTGTMRTPTHFGIGQEAVAVGVCKALNQGDVVFTHHRSHTHYLAQGGNLFGLIAELFGREGGCSRGRGGSVHLVDKSVGFLGSSPILGHSLALAAGSALAFSMDSKDSVAVAFFGDGTFDEGSVWETLNFAAIKKLPVLFVCENNGYATESPMAVRNPVGTEFLEKVRAFGILGTRVDGNNVVDVYCESKKAVEEIRNRQAPFFIECTTYRWREHVGPLWDHEANRTYRTRSELEEWMKKCPIETAKTILLSRGIASPAEISYWNSEIEERILKAKDEASQSPWPLPKTLFDNVY